MDLIDLLVLRCLRGGAIPLLCGGATCCLAAYSVKVASAAQQWREVWQRLASARQARCGSCSAASREVWRPLASAGGRRSAEVVGSIPATAPGTDGPATQSAAARARLDSRRLPLPVAPRHRPPQARLAPTQRALMRRARGSPETFRRRWFRQIRRAHTAHECFSAFSHIYTSIIYIKNCIRVGSSACVVDCDILRQRILA